MEQTFTVTRAERHEHGWIFILENWEGERRYPCLISHDRREISQLGMTRLGTLMRGCGLEVMSDTDEIIGRVLRAVVEEDRIVRIIEAPRPPEPAPPPWIVRAARELLDDWARAPISGTLVVLGLIPWVSSLIAGDIDRALLWLILINLWIIQRGSYRGGVR